jgi:UDP-GlcNAc:undecaprenyl-phosphate GlcNAc-1-phosphate transferase
VAQPDADRHLHPAPTPRLGGIAMFVGFAVAIALFGSVISDRWQVLAVTGAITVAMAIDDILDLSWLSKLAIEIGVGVLAVLLGIVITTIAIPGSHTTSVWDLMWLSAPVTVVWLVGMQVSVNLLDGADGVAAGVIAIVAAVCLLAAINRIEGPADVQSGVVIMSGAVMGCCLGFLVFNLPPARVFMGDSGSHFLGVALGVITVLGVAKVVVGLSILVPLIALGLPIGDTAFAIVRRTLAGRNPAAPDAGHLHHRLRAVGLNPLETAVTFYLVTGILGCLALTIYGHRRIIDLALGLMIVALAVLIWRNRRKVPRLPFVAIEESEVQVDGHRALPSHIHHRGEVD